MFFIALRGSKWYEESDVVKAVAVKNTAFWNVTPCRMDQGRALGDGKSKEGRVLRVVAEIAHYSETLVYLYQITGITSQMPVLFVLMIRSMLYSPCMHRYAYW
jgi:Sec-independent protein secretion pathway component TatC